SFKTMYQQADKQPVLIAGTELDTTVVISSVKNINRQAGWLVFPNPATDGVVTVSNDNNLPVTRIEIWDAMGRKAADIPLGNNRPLAQVTLPSAAGTYYLRIYSGKQAVVKKVIRL
ncbi:MAG TPA: T9SS type A sorting domain-containing protein, partial [Chitinophagales bacterium]|nr:T9SS type A sorting domain-containing protein [Chitinophagales bacterium]